MKALFRGSQSASREGGSWGRRCLLPGKRSSDCGRIVPVDSKLPPFRQGINLLIDPGYFFWNTCFILSPGNEKLRQDEHVPGTAGPTINGLVCQDFGFFSARHNLLWSLAVAASLSPVCSSMFTRRSWKFTNYTEGHVRATGSPSEAFPCSQHGPAAPAEQQDAMRRTEALCYCFATS